MGRKARMAKASLVAAFVAAGGAASTANADKAGPHGRTGGAPSSASKPRHTSLNWGSALVRFLKLDGFPAYLKVEGFAQYYKLLSLGELSDFYVKDRAAVDGVLALYQKGGTARGSQLEGILIGLEQYWKYNNSEPLLNFLKIKGNLDAYVKWEGFSRALQSDAKNAFSFFYKETGIAGLPAVQNDGEIL